MIERNRIIHGDCLDVLRALPAASVDAVVTDPPYSSGGAFRGDRMNDTRSKYVQAGTMLERPEFNGDNRDQRAYGYWCALWLSECWRVAKPGAPILMFTDWRQLPTTTDTLQAGGWTWRGIAVWDKTEGARPAYGRFRNQCEYIVWGSKGPMRHNDGSPCLPGVYRLTVKRDDKHHIAGKPTDLMRQLLRIVRPGGTVLDPFAGSATTCVAAALEGLEYIGIEQNPDYIEVAERRLATVQRPLLMEASA